VRGAASAAHVYGKPLAAAEAFTGGGYEAPFTLKKVADYWLAQGINRLVFHTSAHQPLDAKPGNAMVGTHLNRNITWAEQAAPFFTYLARESHMLQQGQFVADVAYLLNEGAPSTPPIWGPGTQPTPAEGYDFDFVNADVLLNRMTVDSTTGHMILPGGMSYSMLVLPETDRMRPELLRKIRELVLGGAILLGPKPSRSPSLADYPNADAEVRALAADIWGDLDGVSRTIRYLGKGRVVWGWSPAEALAAANIEKDFDYARGLDADLAWLHRRSADADIYYVVNTTDSACDFDARFRVAGREAELWHPDTGAIEPANYSITGDRTIVPLRLAERESVFVVFRRVASAPSRTTPHPVTSLVATIDGPWDVAFPENLGAPALLQLTKLEPLSANGDDGVKYFSGTATYTKTITAPGEWFRPGAAVILDLGRVADIAEISVNDRSLGQLWKAPYQIDVTDALQPGENLFEIKVTNQWTNRIAGDRIAADGKKVLTAGSPPAGRGGGIFGDGGGTLPESGLIGPVTILSKAPTP